VNGVTATTRGTEVQINTDFLDVAIDLNYDTSVGSAPNAARLGSLTAFTITGGGADFMLASKVDIGGKVSLGVQNVAVRDLGRSTADGASGGAAMFLKDLGIGRSLNLVDGDLSVAQNVIERSIRDVNSLRGRLGSFQQNTIGATIRSLGIGLENSTAAESVIRDTEFAGETSRLTQAQVLSQSATSALALANAAPQTVLQLLG
jgi:flagellin